VTERKTRHKWTETDRVKIDLNHAIIAALCIRRQQRLLKLIGRWRYLYTHRQCHTQRASYTWSRLSVIHRLSNTSCYFTSHMDHCNCSLVETTNFHMSWTLPHISLPTHGSSTVEWCTHDAMIVSDHITYQPCIHRYKCLHRLAPEYPFGLCWPVVAILANKPVLITNTKTLT